MDLYDRPHVYRMCPTVADASRRSRGSFCPEQPQPKLYIWTYVHIDIDIYNRPPRLSRVPNRRLREPRGVLPRTTTNEARYMMLCTYRYRYMQQAPTFIACAPPSLARAAGWFALDNNKRSST